MSIENWRGWVVGSVGECGYLYVYSPALWTSLGILRGMEWRLNATVGWLLENEFKTSLR